jgi:hypothetical protein
MKVRMRGSLFICNAVTIRISVVVMMGKWGFMFKGTPYPLAKRLKSTKTYRPLAGTVMGEALPVA